MLKFNVNGPALPTRLKYWCAILVKGRDLEAGKWIAKGRDLAISIASILIIGALTGGYPTSWQSAAMTGLLGLLVFGVWEFLWYLFVGAYSLHCEQIERLNSQKQVSFNAYAEAANERDMLLAEKETQPLRLSDAIKTCRWLVNWLKSESMAFPSSPDVRDNGKQKWRAREIYVDLLMKSETEFNAMWHSTHFDSPQHIPRCRQAIVDLAVAIDQAASGLRAGHFNEHWKPSLELQRLLNDAARPTQI